MGRRKIEITRIENDRHRQVTFAKRKLGVMKKATELSILCNANVAVIVFSANNKMSVYSNCPINSLVQRFMETRDTAEVCSSGWPMAGE
jgi:MADS-box transcription enhancer factor 2